MQGKIVSVPAELGQAAERCKTRLGIGSGSPLPDTIVFYA